MPPDETTYDIGEELAATKQRIMEQHEAVQPDLSQAPVMDSNEALESMKRQIEELKASLERVANVNNVAQNPQVSLNRGLVGTIEKYAVDPSYYPDETSRLSQEAKLQRFAFPMNYEMKFIVETVNYETKDGLSVKEPKFTLDLIRIILDEETGEQTNKRYRVCRQVFFEDPQTAVVIARQYGVEPELFPGGERAFLNEMRYMRMRDWLLEAFYPPKPQPSQNKRETVIGNKLVEVYEVNTELGESSPTIDFHSLKKLS